MKAGKGSGIMKIDVWESFLLKLRYQKAKLLKTSSYTSILLNDSTIAYLVYTGEVDVFSVPLVDQLPSGTRQYLFTAVNGTLLFGTQWQDQAHGMLILQAPATQLLRLDRSTLYEIVVDLVFQDILVDQVNGWIKALNEIVLPKLPPKTFISLESNEYTAPEATETIVQVRESGAWITVAAGEASWIGYKQVLLHPGDQPFPLPRQAWLTMQPHSKIVVTHTADLIQNETLWPAMDVFVQLFIGQLAEHAAAETVKERQRFLDRISNEERQINFAVTQIAQTLNPEQALGFAAISQSDALLTACTLVARAVGIDLRVPATLSGPISLRTITEIARIQTRQVALQEGWWTHDQGPFLGTLASDHQPVALIPLSMSSYEMHDPISGQRTLVTETVATQLDRFATQFYRRFELSVPRFGDLLRLALANGTSDLRNLLVTSILLGFANLSIPIVIGILFDQLVPLGQSARLGWVAFWLLLLVASTFTLQITQRLAMLRLETHAEERLQGAFWGRLLSLKSGFFRQFSAGDLSNRVLELNALIAQLSDAALRSSLGLTYLLFNLLLMVIINPLLAALGVVIASIAVMIIIGLAWRSNLFQRELTHIAGKNTGYLWEFINGIEKFRVAGAEIRVFSTWAKQFTQQRRIALRLRSLQNAQMVFRTGYPLFTLIGLFLFAGQYRSFISVGSFTAFYIGFTQFLNAALELSSAIGTAIGTIPLYERAKPVLEAPPEVNIGLTHPGELSGEIEVNHVSFRYHADQPLILDDISFSVKRGEFVAIVGASGSGKSTLLRLLLGFDQPETGVIYFDQKDLSDLDIHAVRQQFGVVMQNAQLMPSDFFKNIVGTRADLTLEDAWEAARLVGLEKDINAMPMGMQTIVTEGGSTISGGQRQRLLIAAAIVNRPRIIFFDEATSALDNRTQKVVSESLEQLNATRIVIAHRLSTILHADKIIVMQAGKIVQSGTYTSLMRESGPFAEMANRQLAS
jgi:NHLM bacteriocin system ABC transporter ATP-binding protein